MPPGSGPAASSAVRVARALAFGDQREPAKLDLVTGVELTGAPMLAVDAEHWCCRDRRASRPHPRAMPWRAAVRSGPMDRRGGASTRARRRVSIRRCEIEGALPAVDAEPDHGVINRPGGSGRLRDRCICRGQCLPRCHPTRGPSADEPVAVDLVSRSAAPLLTAAIARGTWSPTPRRWPTSSTAAQCTPPTASPATSDRCPRRRPRPRRADELPRVALFRNRCRRGAVLPVRVTDPSPAKWPAG